MFNAKTFRLRYLGIVAVALMAGGTMAIADQLALGPLYQHFGLTLAPGERREALGPLFYSERKDSTRLWAVPPLFSYSLDRETDFAEFDLGYPVLTYDRFGHEYRVQLLQLRPCSAAAHRWSRRARPACQR